MPATITVEAHATPHDSTAVFRLRVNDRTVGEGLTADQAHLLVRTAIDWVSSPTGANSLGNLVERLNASDFGQPELIRAHRDR